MDATPTEYLRLYTPITDQALRDHVYRMDENLELFKRAHVAVVHGDKLIPAHLYKDVSTRE